MFIALVKFPEVITLDQYNQIRNICSSLHNHNDKLQAKKENGRFCLKDPYEYYKDEVTYDDVEGKYYNKKGQEVFEYNIVEYPGTPVVCLGKDAIDVIDLEELYKAVPDIEVTIKKAFPVSFQVKEK